jgi:hypothetical protein
MAAAFTKDPAARLEYTWDWAPWLAGTGDTISSATVAVPPGLTAVEALTVTDTLVTQRVEGGELGATYKLVCQITTSSGLIDERTIDLTILNQ